MRVIVISVLLFISVVVADEGGVTINPAEEAEIGETVDSVKEAGINVAINSAEEAGIGVAVNPAEEAGVSETVDPAEEAGISETTNLVKDVSISKAINPMFNGQPQALGITSLFSKSLFFKKIIYNLRNMINALLFVHFVNKLILD